MRIQYLYHSTATRPNQDTYEYNTDGHVLIRVLDSLAHLFQAVCRQTLLISLLNLLYDAVMILRQVSRPKTGR
jgi:hypothetical protein